ncbi:hypothetical protein ACFQ3Z_15665 [Streptomyces nogalater]
MTVRPDGYLVRTEPGAFLLPVLVAVLRELPHALARLSDPPRLTVTFGQPPVPRPGRPPTSRSSYRPRCTTSSPPAPPPSVPSASGRCSPTAPRTARRPPGTARSVRRPPNPVNATWYRARSSRPTCANWASPPRAARPSCTPGPTAR